MDGMFVPWLLCTHFMEIAEILGRSSVVASLRLVDEDMARHVRLLVFLVGSWLLGAGCPRDEDAREAFVILRRLKHDPPVHRDRPQTWR